MRLSQSDFDAIQMQLGILHIEITEKRLAKRKPDLDKCETAYNTIDAILSNCYCKSYK